MANKFGGFSSYDIPMAGDSFNELKPSVLSPTLGHDAEGESGGNSPAAGTPSPASGNAMRNPSTERRANPSKSYADHVRSKANGVMEVHQKSDQKYNRPGASQSSPNIEKAAEEHKKYFPNG